jgi:hypothetical protein
MLIGYARISKQCHHERNQIPGLLRLIPGDSGLSLSKRAGSQLDPARANLLAP